VGMTEAEAKAAGYTVKTSRFPFAALGKAVASNAPEGLVKVIANADNGLILGVHMVGAEVSNLIAEAALAIEMGAVAQDLALTVHAHPTLAEALMEACEGVYGHAIHAIN
jgi:dihydrolipoamide dehydrogenase